MDGSKQHLRRKRRRCCFFKRLFFLLVLAAAVCAGAGAETFVFKHQTGNKYRIVSVVNEDVYVDRRFSRRARIFNRVSMEVTGAEGDTAQYRASYSTSEESLEGESFQWGREYTSVFTLDKYGHYTIDPEYYVPMVRNVPVFPPRDIKEGESWTAEAWEVHDLRESFGIEEPYRIPFEARYVYLGRREWKGKTFPVFSVSYRIFYEPQAVKGRVWPRRIMEASDQLVYWDPELGQPAAYDENFRMVIELSNGMTMEYRGRAEAEIVESEVMNKEDDAKLIADEIARLGIEDASVRVVDEGITISLENIQFQADSAVLTPPEKEKLDKIGGILANFAGRDILVSGHTALAGTAAGRQRLSLERASAVSNYLILKKVRPPSRIVVRGYGADKPVADNRTAEGMRKNRRVEITLLEN